jgi:hypothetical protein
MSKSAPVDPLTQFQHALDELVDHQTSELAQPVLGPTDTLDRRRDTLAGLRERLEAAWGQLIADGRRLGLSPETMADFQRDGRPPLGRLAGRYRPVRVDPIPPLPPALADLPPSVDWSIPDESERAERFVFGCLDGFELPFRRFAFAWHESTQRTANKNDDESVYVPASELRDDGRFRSLSQITKALDKHPEIRWKRPANNRRMVHLGDWNKMLRESRKVNPKDLPGEVFDEFRRAEQAKADARSRQR